MQEEGQRQSRLVQELLREGIMGEASEVGLALDEVRVPMLSVRFVQDREEKESKAFPVGRVELWL